MKIGVICPSEIAFRRFMPALCKIQNADFVGVGVYSESERFGNEIIHESKKQEIIKNEISKAQAFVDNYGGKIFYGYENLVRSKEIDAIYIPLPPALHYKWVKLALENGKHVLVEKPSTISEKDTKELLKIAQSNNLALHENYMFVYHDQLKMIDRLVREGTIGDPRLYRVNFGFPFLGSNNFRYSKSLGGGALYDAAGYTLKFASKIHGETAKLKYAYMNYIEGSDVDIYGSGALVNDQGTTVQIAYGMDNEYKCELEIWGSEGCIQTGRILTAPSGFVPKVNIIKNGEIITKDLPKDDAFLKSIEHFIKSIDDDNCRIETYKEIEKQSELVEEFKKLSLGNL